MGSAPDRPGNHMSGVDAALRQAHRDTPDLLDRPADQSTGRRALVRVFGGGMVFARWRTAAIIAKASITSETCRCQPCQEPQPHGRGARLLLDLLSDPVPGLHHRLNGL